MFEKTRAVAQKYGSQALVLGAAVASSSAMAAGEIDTTAATTAITAASVAVLAVVAALTTFNVAKWGAMKVAQMFGR